MVNLDSTQIDRHTKPITNGHNTCTTSKCWKPNSDVIHKNHNHLPDNYSDYYYNVNNFIFHQNIRGIFHKTDELIISLFPDTPHVLCLNEHHLRNEEIDTVHLDRCTLGAKFCRKTYKQGGVRIYVTNDIQFNTISLGQHKREKGLEICAIKIGLPSSSLTVICIYRSPTGIFNYFLNQLESVLDWTEMLQIHLLLPLQLWICVYVLLLELCVSRVWHNICVF
jgi:hypothetical protein